MEIYVLNKSEFAEEISNIISIEFKLTIEIAQDLVNSNLMKHIEQLKDNLHFLVETEYIDKVYRDSYYSYYSTKLNKYLRDCIRVSIFDIEIDKAFFRNKDKIKLNRDKFLGFFILRPTEPFLWGRSVISPKAMKHNNVNVCVAYVPTSANSVKFDAAGFPHSSQDTETITCAETTLWAIFEYFGNKYPEYHPILPSEILNKLRNVTYERQLPSHGLEINQMSYFLKEYGLSSKIYSKTEYGNEFESLISTYIESGIPLIISIENIEDVKIYNKKYIGHALICIGRVDIEDYMIDSMVQYSSTYKKINKLLEEKNITIYDWNEIRKQFVFADDNQPIYQKAFLKTPSAHYKNPDWQNCEITHFIVPLQKKVYLEAFQSKNYALGLLTDSPFSIKNLEITLRSFLTSSRSFRQYVSFNSEMSEELKDEILELNTPKLIWVFEISTRELLKKDFVEGIIIIDPTEANTYKYEPLLLAFVEQNIIRYSKISSSLEKYSVISQPFLRFKSNLKQN
jgi:hypothetical protein